MLNFFHRLELDPVVTRIWVTVFLQASPDFRWNTVGECGTRRWGGKIIEMLAANAVGYF